MAFIETGDTAIGVQVQQIFARDIGLVSQLSWQSSSSREKSTKGMWLLFFKRRPWDKCNRAAQPCLP